VALAPSFTPSLKCVEEQEVNLMGANRHKVQKKTGPTRLELLLRLEGDFRKRLGPIRVTPSQAGVILFLRRHAEVRVTDTATALRLRLPTLSEVVKDLVRKRWVTRRRSVTDTRVVHFSLSQRGRVITRKIEIQVRRVSTGVAANKVLTAAGLTRPHCVPNQLKEASS
jgi:DNA-binding MarR family transcriptional regulator